ncbi:MAG: CerR family C-terminal domain-containing protein [Candidatus Acidiferrales bacterium]|jgi:AcrR family transcriptional regulator
MPAGRKKVKNPMTARRILAAAEEHFADQGMAGARTEEIAAAAHANKAMLYYYFGDKRRLHRAVMENLLRQLRNAAFAPLAAKTSSRDRLIAWVNGYFDFFAVHPNYPRLVQREVMDTAPKFEWIVREYFRPFHKRLRSLIEEGVASGEFRKVDAEQTVFTMLGMTVFYFAAAPVMSQVSGRKVLSPQALRERKHALLDFLDHGLMRVEPRQR